MNTPIPNLDQMSRSERLQLVQDLWDSIAAEPESVPVTDKHKDEIARRLAAYRQDNDTGAPWSEVRERLQDER